MKNGNAIKAIGNDSLSYLFDNTELIGVQGLGQITDALQFGDAMSSDFIHGQHSSNVHSALQQLASAITPINGILITASPTSPSGVSFQEDIRIDGVSDSNYVLVYGKYIEIEELDSNLVVAGKIEDYFSGNDLFRSVTNLNNGSIRITHKDNMRHTPYNWVGNGLTLTGSVYQQSDVDNTVYFGTWDLVGTETKFSQDFYYWKRIA